MKTISYFFRQEEISKSYMLFYALIICPYVVMSVLSKYGDCISLTNMSINIWDALFSGRIREYFLVSAQTARDAPHGGAAYGILYLLPWAIWNFPLWLSRVITKSNSVSTVFCLTWSKLFLIACAHIMAVYCAKIVRFFTGDKELDIPAFLCSLGCGTMFLSVAFFGQDEIIYMAALVAAVYYILTGRKKLGYLLLGVSCTLCNIMLVPALAILLIKEKNLLKVGILIVCFALPEKIVSAFCGIGQLSEIAQSYKVAPPISMRTLFDWFFMRTQFQASDFRISFFAVSLILLYAFCYLQKSESHENENFRTLLFPALSLLAMNIFSWQHCYRWFIYFPLLSACVFIKGKQHKNLKTGLLVLSVYDFARVFFALTLKYNVRVHNFRNLIKKIWDANGYAADFWSLFTYVLDEHLVNMYSTVISAATIACAILIIIFLKRQTFADLPLSKNGAAVISTVSPALVLCLVLSLPVFINIQARDIGGNGKLSSPINNEKSLEIPYKSSSLTRLRFIKIRPCTWNKTYPAELNLFISLVDKESGEIVMKKAIPASTLPNNRIMKVPFDVRLKKDHEYRFVYTGGGYTEAENLFLITDYGNPHCCVVQTRF